MSMLGAEGQMGVDILHFSQPRLRQEVVATQSRSGVQFVQAAQWASMLAMVAAPIIAVAALSGGGGGGGGGGGDALIAAMTGGASSSTTAPVPEPASIAIFVLSGALLGLALYQRRRPRCTEST
jgi:hypothetical protein